MLWKYSNSDIPLNWFLTGYNCRGRDEYFTVGMNKEPLIDRSEISDNFEIKLSNFSIFFECLGAFHGYF